MTGPADAALAAEARSRAWSVLGELLAGGGATVLDEARKSPLLAEALDDDADEAMADLEQVLRFDAMPWEGVYLDPAMQLGGEAATALHDLYARCGSSLHPSHGEPEHIANLLLCLDHLSGAEADAESDSRTDLVTPLRELQRELMDHHLLRWLPTWAVAARRSGSAFPSAVAAQVMDLALFHRGALGEPWPDTFDLDSVPLNLADDSIGLRDIGEALARPAFTGVFLTRADLRDIAREHGTPAGFGSRADTLETLLRESSQRDVLPDVVSALVTTLRRHDNERSALVSQGPWMSLLVTPHQARVHATLDLLEEVVERYREQAS
ncbi:MAG: molecular chaperone TorD family protein [Planctomycetota bacterium]|jgi:hypothetical protein